MNRFFLVLFAALLASPTMADTKQTVVVSGQPVGKTVKQITFDGDNVVLTYTDDTSQAEDMSLVKISFAYGETTGVNQVENVLPVLQQGRVYNLNGQFLGNTTEGLDKGVYIVNGKKFIVK